jgi:hypothetical protein
MRWRVLKHLTTSIGTAGSNPVWGMSKPIYHCFYLVLWTSKPWKISKIDWLSFRLFKDAVESGKIIMTNGAFFLFSWGKLRLSPLGTSDTYWLIVPAPDKNEYRQFIEWELAREPEILEESPCPSATLSATNSTWIDPGSNRGRRSVNRLLTAWAMARPSRVVTK